MKKYVPFRIWIGSTQRTFSILFLWFSREREWRSKSFVLWYRT